MLLCSFVSIPIKALRFDDLPVGLNTGSQCLVFMFDTSFLPSSLALAGKKHLPLFVLRTNA
jgi:hypothetical protein